MAAFLDRIEAGRQLAGLLAAPRVRPEVIVGVPPGGLEVAAQVARALEVPLDARLVCRVRAVDRPGLVVGALAEGGALCLETGALRACDRAADLAGAAHELELLVRRVRAGGKRIDLGGRRVAIVDDGVESGATLLAAVRAVRREEPRWIVAAAPVIPGPALARLREEADEVVAIAEGGRADVAWYEERGGES
jgi:putative phosphoribosyl transferase